MDQNELNDLNEEEVYDKTNNNQPKSFFGFDYNYASDTEDELKYISKENKNFSKMKKEAKRRRLLGLWRKAYNQGVGCAIIINQFVTIHTKMVYFGRQVLGGGSSLDKKAIEEVT